jgi:hypothetical protein
MTANRARVGLLVLLGAFLVPVAVSPLRGLTHVLACQAEVGTPFTVFMEEDGTVPTVLSSSTTERDDAEGLCGGLRTDLAVQDLGEGTVRLIVPISNTTSSPWRGTVRVAVGATRLPLRLGLVPAGEMRSDSVVLRLRPGTHVLDGTLLIGP